MLIYTLGRRQLHIELDVLVKFAFCPNTNLLAYVGWFGIKSVFHDFIFQKLSHMFII